MSRDNEEVGLRSQASEKYEAAPEIKEEVILQKVEEERKEPEERPVNPPEEEKKVHEPEEIKIVDQREHNQSD